VRWGCTDDLDINLFIVELIILNLEFVTQKRVVLIYFCSLLGNVPPQTVIVDDHDTKL
jgi:hypothetical protein